jgi:hypothetical protein
VSVVQVVADRVLLARLVLIREELRALAERQSAQQFWELNSTEDSATAAAEATTAAAGADAHSAASGGSSSSQPFFAFHRSNLPARCAAFLKNLLTVQDVTTRLGLLTKVGAAAVLEQADGTRIHMLTRQCPSLCHYGAAWP